MPSDMIDALPSLKVIIRAGAGFKGSIAPLGMPASVGAGRISPNDAISVAQPFMTMFTGLLKPV